uniref:RE66124p n=1 Tax=Drosophila melanogaster TaxID=7227 RepID=Q8SZQ8_DROME|nr:RE66124p [Drosophila melanogaster]
MTDKLDAEQFNDDELEAPAWLNRQFIEEILSAYEDSPELKVVDLKITPASAQGDHYASVMFRTTAECTTAKGKFSRPLIIKAMPEQDGHKKDMLSESHLFETEIGMYCQVLPEFERILRESGDDTKLFVPCIYHSLEPRKVMIFEDLVPQGYYVIRDRPVAQEELKTAFAKLAKWHAISMKYIKEQPDFLKEFKYGLFEMPTVKTDPFITTGMQSFIEMLDRLPELRKYKPHFEKIKDKYMQRLQAVMKEYHENRKSDAFYVLCHGDFHLRNMMFKNNKGTGAHEDTMLVDFQISNLCPITIDLTYSIYMLMEPEQRREMGKDLINHYLTVLVATLKSIGYPGELPTQAKLWDEIHKNKYYDFFLLSTFLPLILAIKSKSFKVNDLIQDPETRQKTYFLDTYVKDVSQLLPKFEQLGYFKCL